MPPRPPMVEQGNPGRDSTQPPLLPSGFVQNEQGALIAVYQSEALTQYTNVSGDAPHTVYPQGNGGQKYTSTSEIMYPRTALNVPIQGHPNNALLMGGRVAESQHSPNPFQSTTPNLNMHFNPFHRRSHGLPTQHNLNNATRHNRAFNGRPGLQNTSDYGRRGGQRGRPFSDWN